MSFKNKDELLEYIEENSRIITKEMPYCAFCDNVIDSCDGFLEYYELETEDGFEIFCCEWHMKRYLEQYYLEEK